MTRALIAALGAVVALGAAPSPFAGKFELVPLFTAGHRPVLRNGHVYSAVRNRITFRTTAGNVVEVLPGERTDLASIPRFLWPVLPPDGAWAEAAVFHDQCYKSRGTFWGRATWALDRAGCDEVLREGMAALGVGAFPRVTIWSAVRMFGGGAWGT